MTNKIPRYEIITTHRAGDDPDALYEEQEAKCAELGLDTSFAAKEISCHFFSAAYFNEQFQMLTIYDAIELLPAKDGMDLVRYENGNYGFVAYYNGNVSGFEVINMEINLISRWDDAYCGDRYMELHVAPGCACCVKERYDGFLYVIECCDGNEVYDTEGGADYPLRKLTDEEREAVMSFAREQLTVEDEMLEGDMLKGDIE